MRHHAKLLVQVLLPLISLSKVKSLARHASSALRLWCKSTGVWVSSFKIYCLCKHFLNSCVSCNGWEAIFQVKTRSIVPRKTLMLKNPFLFHILAGQTSDCLFLLCFHSAVSLLWWVFCCASCTFSVSVVCNWKLTWDLLDCRYHLQLCCNWDVSKELLGKCDLMDQGIISHSHQVTSKNIITFIW